jgi:hypothetical protein
MPALWLELAKKSGVYVDPELKAAKATIDFLHALKASKIQVNLACASGNMKLVELSLSFQMWDDEQKAVFLAFQEYMGGIGP